MGQTERAEPETSGIEIFLDPLRSVQELLDEYGKQGLVIGGVAASLLGRPRLTNDIDAVIMLGVDDIPDLIRAASRHGMEKRIDDAASFARRNKVLLLRHVSSGTNIAIMLGMLPFEKEMVERCSLWNVGDLQIRLTTPEDLIISKAVHHHPQDLADIEAISAANPELDKRRIQLWVEQFSDALEMPELWSLISALL